MNPLTLEWVEKAEGDFITAGREYRARKTPNYDAVCFHYPGLLIDRAEAKAELLAVERVRLFVRTKLGL